MGDAVVGVVANPLSGRDIRRLVTQASVFLTVEKANMIQRMLTAFGAVGVHRVLLSTDLGGISAAVCRWPEVEFLDGQPIRQTAQDTLDAVRRMVTAGAGDRLPGRRRHGPEPLPGPARPAPARPARLVK
jgi:predicted polyphosphate/ATP-dependent NAD kinase